MKPDKYSMFYSVDGIEFVRVELASEMMKLAQNQVFDEILEDKNITHTTDSTTDEKILITTEKNLQKIKDKFLQEQTK